MIRPNVPVTLPDGTTYRLQHSSWIVLKFLRYRGWWATTVDIIRHIPTTTPSKRLSVLWKLGLIEKRPGPALKQYRAVRIPK